MEKGHSGGEGPITRTHVQVCLKKVTQVKKMHKKVTQVKKATQDTQKTYKSLIIRDTSNVVQNWVTQAKCHIGIPVLVGVFGCLTICLCVIFAT